MDKFDITNTLIYNLDKAARISRLIGMRFFENCPELDITFNEFFIINTLYLHPDIHQREFAKIMLKGSANLSRDLEKLEKKGLLKRSIKTKGKWVVKSIYLTEEGEKLVRKATLLSQEHITKIQKIYSPPEYKQFMEFLSKLIQEMTTNEEILIE